MIVKICVFCKNKINPGSKARRFCSDLCQRRYYNQRPEVKEKNRIKLEVI